MDEHGQIYFDNEDLIPEEDKKRLEKAQYDLKRAQEKAIFEKFHELEWLEAEREYLDQ